jgi:hypothetical protein
MGDWFERPTHRPRHIRSILLLASLAFHGVILGLLIISIRPTPTPKSATPIKVFLYASKIVLHHQVRAADSLKNNEEPRASIPLLAGGQLQSRQVFVPPTLPAGTSVRSPVSGDVIPDERVRNALKGLLGCQPNQIGPLDEKAKLNCDKKLIAAGRTASPIDPIPSEKRDYYDAVVATREALRHGPIQGTTAQAFPDAVSGYYNHGTSFSMGYHCTIKFGAGAAEANKQAGVRVGFPPCPIKPPKGSSLQEVDPSLLPPK